MVRPHHLTRAAKVEAEELGAGASDVGAPAPHHSAPAPIVSGK